MRVNARAPWSRVSAVHGEAGNSGWRQIAVGHAIDGPWEAVEAAYLPPGGVSGRHYHARTNEMYVILTGHALVSLNATSHLVGPETAVITRIGDTHGIKNVGVTDMSWLVLECAAKKVRECLNREGNEGNSMQVENRSIVSQGVDIFSLNDDEPVSLSGLDVAPLESCGIMAIAAGEGQSLVANDCELFLYVLSGFGSATAEGSGAVAERFVGDTGITITWRERIHIKADTATRIFWARAAVEVDRDHYSRSGVGPEGTQ